jgi:ribosomal protein S18 acetylase RimI-like enzyme
MKKRIRKMTDADINSVAEIHRQTFPRQGSSEKWIECNFRAYPRMQYFVAEDDSGIVGFIHWTQKSGFRREVVLELEQIGVLPQRQAQGIGRRLIEQSIPMVREQLNEHGATIKHFMVTTRSDNYAQKLYHKTLSARVECIISDLYSADEVLMIARNVNAGKT